MASLEIVLLLLLWGGGAPSIQAPARSALEGAQISGRATLGVDTYLLDTTPGRIRVWRVDSKGLVRESLALDNQAVRLEPFGLAVSADGLLWVLADKGRTLAGFHPQSGKIVDIRVLPTNCITLWSVEGVVMLAALRLSGDQQVLYVMTRDGFRPCGSLRSRPAKSPLDAPILALFTCGGSRSGILPCWWMAGESAVILLRDSCASKTIRVASRTTPGDPSRAMRADPIDRFEYPIRDVFRVDERRIWLLTNQEGSGLSEETAARHVLLVTDGNLARTVPLQRKGRLLLAADSHQLTVLYADGGIETIPVP